MSEKAYLEKLSKVEVEEEGHNFDDYDEELEELIEKKDLSSVEFKKKFFCPVCKEKTDFDRVSEFPRFDQAHWLCTKCKKCRVDTDLEGERLFLYRINKNFLYQNYRKSLKSFLIFIEGKRFKVIPV